MQQSVEMNLANFQRVFLVSAANVTDVESIGPWCQQHGIPEGTAIEFVGPHALHNLEQTALNIGQSFKQAGDVMVINMDNDPKVLKFTATMRNYEAAQMNYVTINAIDNELRVEDRVIKLHLTKLSEKDMQDQQSYIDPLQTMTWEQAKEKLFAYGGPVRRLSMNPNHFIGWNKGDTIEAEKFWVPANKKAALRNGGSMNVAPYYTFCDGKTVSMGWRPSMEDELATDWITADKFLTLFSLEQTPAGDFIGNYMLQPGDIDTSGKLLFTTYSFLSKEGPSQIAILTGSSSTGCTVGALLTDMKMKLYSPLKTAKTKYRLGDSTPYSDELLSVEFTEPGINVDTPKDMWIKEEILKTVIEKLENNPELVLIFDLKGFADDPAALDTWSREEVNENAVALCEFVRRGLNSHGGDLPCRWFVIDLDELSHNED